MQSWKMDWTVDGEKVSSVAPSRVYRFITPTLQFYWVSLALACAQRSSSGRCLAAKCFGQQSLGRLSLALPRSALVTMVPSRKPPARKQPARKQPERSPLTDNPLRNPGQSVDDALWDLLHDEFFFWFLLGGVTAITTGLEWWRWIAKLPPSPFWMSAFALPLIAYCAWRAKQGLKRAEHLRLGRDGERAVGQFLERLRVQGYQVFHDIPGPDFNLDHVLIGPAGIFTIETKTYSKPRRGNPKISFDGHQLTIGPYQPDRAPVVQATAQAQWLSQLLGQSTGQNYGVKPVIVFPGWFIEPLSTEQKQLLWLLNPKALPAFLEKSPSILTDEKIHLTAYHLSRHIRTS